MPSVAKRRLAIAEVVVEEKIESVESAVAEVGIDDGVEPMRETRPEELRLLEALLFASGEPLDEKTLAARLPPGFAVPTPSDDPALRDDEDPLEPGDLDLGLAPPPDRVEE